MTYGIINADLMTTSDGVSSAGLYGMKNRLINGDMKIDQRNAGASVTPTSGATYTLDRFGYYCSISSKGSLQQNAGSVTPPAGFTKYLGFTSSSAYSVLSTDIFEIYQFIEGQNVADLAFGTASAATITVSFWVRSSLTGTFGAAVGNNANTRNYPFTYTISAANTWEYKTVTIPGDTTGTWLTTNGIGLYLVFNLGAGSTYSGTAGAWNGTSNAIMPTGSVSVVGTSGATFYITGVQLEKGSTATSFDYRPYGTELALCQRYYQQVNTAGNSAGTIWSSNGASINYVSWFFKTSMRASPTIAGSTNGNINAANTENVSAYAATTTYAAFGYNGSTYGPATASAEL